MYGSRDAWFGNRQGIVSDRKLRQTVVETALLLDVCGDKSHQGTSCAAFKAGGIRGVGQEMIMCRSRFKDSNRMRLSTACLRALNLNRRISCTILVVHQYRTLCVSNRGALNRFKESISSCQPCWPRSRLLLTVLRSRLAVPAGLGGLATIERSTTNHERHPPTNYVRMQEQVTDSSKIDE